MQPLHCLLCGAEPMWASTAAHGRFLTCSNAGCGAHGATLTERDLIEAEDVDASEATKSPPTLSNPPA